MDSFPPNLRSLLIFGGSFDPPHLAHLAVPLAVRDRLSMDKIAYIPAARPPHKLDQVQTPAHHRLAMLQLALEDQPCSIIITNELDRAHTGEPSYTIDTLDYLRHHLPAHATMRLLIGVDQLLIFDTWKDPERIIALAEPAVVIRPPHTRDSVLASLPTDQRALWAHRLIDIPQINISSTDIRRRVAAGEPIAHLVPPPVARYIHEHNLYRTHP